MMADRDSSGARSSRETLDRLTEVSRQIEAHRTAIWLLEQQRYQLCEQLVSAGWTPPAVPEKA